jgi:diguanylate cyclase (GGDEF)-like protein
MGQFERLRVGELARRMSALLLSELSLDVVFERLCVLLADFVEAPVVFIALRNPDGSFLEFRRQAGRVARLISKDLPQQDLIDKALASGTGFINRDPAGLFAPLRIGDESIGVLVTESEALNEYLPDDLALLESVAPYVAVAIRNRTLQDAVAHEKYRADHDALTGLANRALFTDRLAQAVRRADRSGELVGVIYADLDGFKAVNDMLGHAAGDDLLRTVAKRLCDSVRVSDTVARMGGDEFAMILERLHSRLEIDKVIDKMQRGVLRPITVAQGPVDVGISIGHSIYPLDGLDVDQLLERADVSMYAVKERHHRQVSA